MQQMNETIEILEHQRWEGANELEKDFIVHSFAMRFVMVTHKKSGIKGSLEFDHMPRVYYGFIPES